MLYTVQFKEWVQATGTRIAKVLGMVGALTVKECAPFGVDTNPLKDMMAIYATTPNSSQKYIVGYINKGQLAEEGETRLYSVDLSGNLQSYIWNKKDGTLELNGNTYSAVRYAPLNTGLQNEVSLINQNFTALQTAITSLGGTYLPINVTVNISSAESPKVKLK